jgi:poly(A) polymerase
MINSIQRNFINDPMSKKIMTLLNEEEDSARFVGGCVRDSLINIKTNDIDIATKIKPENVIKILSSNSIKVIPTGIDHGTVSVFTDDFNFEITTLRSDVETDGRHAKVIFTNDWFKDSMRRDFTFNSIYLSPKGDIFDPHNGTSDLFEGIIKFIGNSEERIREDYLRILRYFRFSAYYGNDNVQFSSSNIAACKILGPELKKISSERIQNEFFKILISPRAKKVIQALHDADILKILFDQVIDFSFFLRMVDIDTKHSYQPDSLLRFISLIHLQNITYDQLNMFNFSNKQKNLILLFINKKLKFSMDMRLNELNKIFYFFGKEISEQGIRLFWSRDNDALNDSKWLKILKNNQNWKKPVFPIKAEDVMCLGIEEGPIFGEILDELEEIWISSDFINTRSFLLNKLKEIVRLKI